MMTNKEHDDAWLNVMGSCVPTATEYLRVMAKYTEVNSKITLLKELREQNMITGEQYQAELKDLSEYSLFQFFKKN